MNPYRHFVSETARLVSEGKSLPLGGLPPPPHPQISPDAPRALIFSPHPDDECVVGALPLRLLREAKMNVVNVAVTLGGRKERQTARLEELKRACDYLGFGLLQTGPDGLERISPATRAQEPAYWQECVETVAKILALQQPGVVFFPHESDWNRTHVGTHFLLLDALKLQLARFACYVVETEFWGAMIAPNLVVESSDEDVADLVVALSFHVGEVGRNPYHLRLPAWMQDNVRRGSELVGGQGAAAPDFTFATIYRLRKWTQGRLTDVFDGGKFLSREANLGLLFA